MNNTVEAADQTTPAPVTVVISRRVIPGKEAEFESLCTELTQAASGFAGHQGASLFRPVNGSDPEYRIIFRFDSADHLEIWDASAERAALIGRIESLLLSPTRRDITYGITGWFDLPGQPLHTPPAKYKMTIVSWLALYPIVTAIFLIFAPWLNQIPLLLRTLLVTAAVMVLMSYVAMPRMTRWFSFWLFPKD
jgi:uncharacterized protein